MRDGASRAGNLTDVVCAQVQRGSPYRLCNCPKKKKNFQFAYTSSRRCKTDTHGFTSYNKQTHILVFSVALALSIRLMVRSDSVIRPSKVGTRQ
jgi:hypothetical protein